MRFTLGLITGIIITRHLTHAQWWQRTLWWIFGNGA